MWTNDDVMRELFRVAQEYGTPYYVYSAQGIRERCRVLRSAFAGLSARWYYAVKANPRKAIVSLIYGEGFGAEVVSIGEAYIALQAGVPPENIVFNGNAKTTDEVHEALARGIRRFNFDSLDQWELLEEGARKAGQEVEALARLNPDVAADHPHLSVGSAESKFGMSAEEILSYAGRWKTARGAKVCGVHCHTGSQFLTAEPLIAGARAAIAVFQELRARGLPVHILNLGGGFGVPYHPTELTFPVGVFADGIRKEIAGLGDDVELCFEPGRYLVAESGAIVARVVSIKTRGARTIVAVDAGMTENIRPALYGAYHHIIHLGSERQRLQKHHRDERPPIPVDIVGPVCESGDFLALGFPLAPANADGIRRGDVILISHCGAYAPAMQSNYNSRVFPAEYFLESRENGPQARLIRARQSISHLLALEE
ncbi:MAG: diaminopimelate decarboxylase [bacterium JZ-2024 1]